MPPIRFAQVLYDSPGSNGGSNPSLNAEWFVLKNNGQRRSLTEWTVRDAAGHVYRFQR